MATEVFICIQIILLQQTTISVTLMVLKLPTYPFISFIAFHIRLPCIIVHCSYITWQRNSHIPRFVNNLSWFWSMEIRIRSGHGTFGKNSQKY